jgi:predicted helicase
VDTIQNLREISDKLALLLAVKGKNKSNKKQLKALETEFLSDFSSSFNEDDQYHLLLALSYWNALVSSFSLPSDTSLSVVKKLKKEKAKEILEDLILYSLHLYDKYYIDDIQQLIKDHPINSVDEDGHLFWSG